jgi:hypothetical protein
MGLQTRRWLSRAETLFVSRNGVDCRGKSAGEVEGPKGQSDNNMCVKTEIPTESLPTVNSMKEPVFVTDMVECKHVRVSRVPSLR